MISVKELKELSKDQNILYAEDEEIIRDGMQNTLSKLFKNAFIATNGQEALDIYKKEEIDLILTDINMPIMDGVELIKEINKLADNPIITVLSAHDDSELLVKLINLEVNNFLNKPSSKEKLIKILYKNCSIISDKKLIRSYSKQLEEENDAMIRKNKILEQKLNQIAHLKNSVEKTEKNNSTNTNTNTKEQYYKTITQEEKDELNELTQDLDVLMIKMYNNKEFNEESIEEISNLYNKYASVLNFYPEFYNFANILYDFASKIILYKDKFLKDLDQTSIYFESLQLSIETFRQNVWIKMEKDPSFYNASLKSDIQVVLNFLEDKEVENDDDDIDFF
ncbi:MAG: response regulator [Campylobacterota bacterium]|nr:response regulator [Campylobacterota bacterium]